MTIGSALMEKGAMEIMNNTKKIKYTEDDIIEIANLLDESDFGLLIAL